MSAGEILLWTSSGVGLLVLVGSLFVVGKAVLAYRQHGSRSMLLLAVGLFLLLVVARVYSIVTGVYVESSDIVLEWDSGLVLGVRNLILGLIRLSGVAALVASLYVRE